MVWFYDALARHGQASAAIDAEREISYSDLAALADRTAVQFGVSRQLIFIEVRNDIDSLAHYLGALRTGHVVYLFGEGDSARVGQLVSLYEPNLVVSRISGALVTERHSDRRHVMHPKLKLLLSTSGSTGSPKFVKLSAENIGSNASAIADYLQITRQDRAATTLKPHYSYGLSVINSHLQAGASLFLTNESVSDAGFWSKFRHHGATGFAGVPYTFELLEKNPDWTQTPGLRHVTQAGGRLSPELVSNIAARAEKAAWRFYVMYGQTEASPRMAYLPPEMAATHPEAIGVPIPGGTLSIQKDDGEPIDSDGVSGELLYRGPNVMMGYAEGGHQLGTDETPEVLRTGDIAVREDGLFRIVGRTSRFIKLFGVRMNLDEVQAHLRDLAPETICTGNDDRLVIAILDGSAVSSGTLTDFLSDRYQIPAFVIAVLSLPSMPLLPNGKTDYQALIAAASTRAGPTGSIRGPISFHDLVNLPRILVSGRFYRRVAHEATSLLGLAKSQWASVRDIYAAFTRGGPVTADSSFSSLAGDSLSYVQVTLALETYLGVLPDSWDTLTVTELEAMRDNESVL